MSDQSSRIKFSATLEAAKQALLAVRDNIPAAKVAYGDAQILRDVEDLMKCGIISVLGHARSEVEKLESA